MQSKRGNRAGIHKIGLSGFQVFNEYTEIDVGRLTLMYGPNSAGKSSVEDALSMFRELWRSDIDAGNHQGFHEGVIGILDRHWRVSGSAGGHVSKTMRLDVSLLLSCDDFYECLGISTGRTPEAGYKFPEDAYLNFCFHIELGCGDGKYTVQERVVYVDGLLLVGVGHDEIFSLNIGHPVLKDFPFSCDMTSMAIVAPSVFSDQDSILKIHGRDMFVRGNNVLLSDDLNLEIHDFFVSYDSDPSSGKVRHLNALIETREGRKEFSLLFNYLINPFSYSSEFDCILAVPASRKIPSKNDLTFILNADKGLSRFSFGVGGDDRYRSLAQSFGCKDSTFADKINDYLTKHLFIDRGYNIVSEKRYIVNPMSNRCPETADIESLCALIVIELVDASGHTCSFEDVGSGLGYVLPVLCAVSELSRSLVLIQQPELHLHPALQAAMGDVLIDALDDSKTFLVETHSEHLLLRILKRVRQTSSGNIIDPSLRIFPEDVCVLYFDPQLDGTTFVKHLRVSSDGDFLDMWPNGFFPERDQELFDE